MNGSYSLLLYYSEHDERAQLSFSLFKDSYLEKIYIFQCFQIESVLLLYKYESLNQRLRIWLKQLLHSTYIA